MPCWSYVRRITITSRRGLFVGFRSLYPTMLNSFCICHFNPAGRISIPSKEDWSILPTTVRILRVFYTKNILPFRREATRNFLIKKHEIYIFNNMILFHQSLRIYKQIIEIWLQIFFFPCTIFLSTNKVALTNIIIISIALTALIVSAQIATENSSSRPVAIYARHCVRLNCIYTTREVVRYRMCVETRKETRRIGTYKSHNNLIDPAQSSRSGLLNSSMLGLRLAGKCFCGRRVEVIYSSRAVCRMARWAEVPRNLWAGGGLPTRFYRLSITSE